jgi:cobalt/nickel transport system permease protein
VLAAACLLAAAVFARGSLRVARKLLASVVPLTAALCLASWAYLALVTGRAPDTEPFAALLARVVLIAFITFSALHRVNLFQALAPWPALTRLLAITLVQIHALRLLATESLLGLRSRLPRMPGALDVLRGAGGITTAMFMLSTRNCRDVADAMRSRGCE